MNSHPQLPLGLALNNSARFNSFLPGQNLEALTDLGYEVVGQQPPTATERIRIAILSGKYSIYRIARSFAERLGLRMPN